MAEENITTDSIEYIDYELPTIPDVETYQENFDFGKSIEKLDANISIKNIPEPIAPVATLFEYAICPTTSTCVAPLSSHVIPLDFPNADTNDSTMLATADKITITTAGTYMVTCSIVYSNLVTSGTWRGINARKNGVAISVDEINPRSGWTYTNATCLTKCVVGDTIDFIGLNDATSCVDTKNGINQTFLHVARVSD